MHENVQLFAELNGVEPDQPLDREKKALDVVGLWERKDDLVGHLSGGMQHRASLACAMINEPALMFLDEPTVGVDPELRAGFWEHFRSLKAAGRTVVLTTHYMDEASRCDLVGMMHKGGLIAEGTPAALMSESGRDNLEDAFLVFIRRCQVELPEVAGDNQEGASFTAARPAHGGLPGAHAHIHDHHIRLYLRR